MTPIACPLTGQAHDGLVQLIDGEFGIFERVTNGIDNLLRLFRCEAYAVWKRGVRRDRRKRSHPDWKIISGKQVDRAARAVGLDQPVVIPQRLPHGRPGGSVNAQCQGQLGRGQHLSVSAADNRGDLSGIGSRWRRRQQCVPLQTPYVGRRPGHLMRHRTPALSSSHHRHKPLMAFS
jgi:hypothetical protein